MLRHRTTLIALAGIVVLALAAAFIPWSLPRQTIDRDIAAPSGGILLIAGWLAAALAAAMAAFPKGGVP